MIAKSQLKFLLQSSFLNLEEKEDREVQQSLMLYVLKTGKKVVLTDGVNKIQIY